MPARESINVVLVEDDPEDAHLLERALRKSGIDCRLTHLQRLSDALAFLEHNLTDVVVLDLGLPDTEGLNTLERVQSSDPSLPIVILTGNDDEQHAKRAVEAGAQDYVSKNQLDGRCMGRALSYAVRRKRAENRLRIGVSELEHVIETDELTGAVNRRSLLRRLPDVWEFAERTGDAVSCVMADIDFFKLVNDTHGHPLGDEALAAVAQALLGIARPSDLVCRYGGEEFCVLLRGVDENEAVTWAERARA
ncbi:MAG: diguanylate cyclase, partial [Planctomycetales bacterium]|nr:diguanylate cyclase [Planctomycetales bacterium]